VREKRKIKGESKRTGEKEEIVKGRVQEGK